VPGKEPACNKSMPEDKGTIEELFKGMEMFLKVMKGEPSVFDNHYLTEEEEAKYDKLEAEIRDEFGFICKKELEGTTL